jgi:hypothetical protein
MRPVQLMASAQTPAAALKNFRMLMDSSDFGAASDPRSAEPMSGDAV